MSAQQYAIFLCHNAEDKAAVRIVGQQLEAAGHKVFLDEWELRPGFAWQALVESALQASKTIAVFVGPKGLGQWQEEEMRVALNQQKERGVAVVPVALPGVSLDRVKVPSFLTERTWITFDSLELEADSFVINFDKLVWAITGVKSERLHGLRAPRQSPPIPPSADRVTEMVRRVGKAIPLRNLVCFIGRSWSSKASQRAMNENTTLAGRLFRELQVADSDYSGFLPALDDLTTCFSAGRGGESLHFAIEEILGAAGREELEPLTQIARILRSVLDSRIRTRSSGIPDSPIIISTSIDLQAERALLCAGIPFVRMVQRLVVGRNEDQISIRSTWFDVHASDNPGKFALKCGDASSVFDPNDLVEVDDLVRAAVFEDFATGDPTTPLPLPTGRGDYVILVKYLGSLDVPDSCILTRDRAIELAQLTARYRTIFTSLIQSALSSRACLLVGFRPLDADFILLYHTLLRRSLNIAEFEPSLYAGSSP